MVYQVSDRVGVMYLGNMVEIADYDKLYEKRYHPYTEALLSAIPPGGPGCENRADPSGGGSQSVGSALRLPVPYAAPRLRQVPPGSAPVKGKWLKGILWPATCIHRLLKILAEDTGLRKHGTSKKDCNMGDTARTLASQ